jgi:hypothetical protein
MSDQEKKTNWVVTPAPNTFTSTYIPAFKWRQEYQCSPFPPRTAWLPDSVTFTFDSEEADRKFLRKLLGIDDEV